MAPQFHEVKIASIKVLTPEAKTFAFDIPAHLTDQFQYIPGQYITVEVEVDGKRERRAYSLCSSPITDSQPAVGVKKVEMGKVSTYMNDRLQVGDPIRIMPPMGNFTHHPDATLNNHYVLFGGGSGITPLMSILKSVLQREVNSRVTLFYANRNMESIMFRDVLDELANQYAGRFTIIHSLDTPQAGWEGETGLMTAEKVGQLMNQYLNGQIAIVDYFICGPGGMMAEVDKALNAKMVAKDKIHKEFFSAPITQEEANVGADGDQEVADSPLDKAELVITLDGDDFEINYDGEDSLLESALDNDVDAPFACQVGACCTCRAKLHEGKVHMADRESLSDEEIEEGYILTCQSKPLTARLVYSYDE